GSYDTHYIESHFDPTALHRKEEEIELVTIAASISAFNYARKASGAGGFRSKGVGGGGSWRRAARWEGLRLPRR
ncbi:MAG: hypothetical protein KAT30_02150, partial [Candidatus Krumholzibacteria bacterium]|nr:hypothetical protein [Candidatus Krumholzibacteria bacterium]